MSSFIKSMDIASSALTAQRMRMDVIAENIANMSTTRTADGTPYQRRYCVFQEREGTNFGSMLSKVSSGSENMGVRVSGIYEDQSAFKLDYDPDHPDAGEDGYVRMPNVDVAVEMVDMMSATRSYEANITSMNAIKSMAMKALEI